MNRVCCFLFFRNSYILNYFFSPNLSANGMLISAQRATAVTAPSVGVLLFFFFFAMNSAAFVSPQQCLILKTVCVFSFSFFFFLKKHYIWDFIY